MIDTSGSVLANMRRPFLGVSKTRMDIHAVHNDNLFLLVYTLEIEINLLDFNPDYPKAPKTLGERIRKARMNKGLLIRELASYIGVAEDTVINWEIRGMKPRKGAMERIKSFLEV